MSQIDWTVQMFGKDWDRLKPFRHPWLMEHIDILRRGGGGRKEHLEGSKIQEKFGNDLKFECFPSLHPDPLA